MTKATLTQFSFNRGELDPVLHGRSDWKYYYSGAERLRNMIPRAQGGAVKRGGLRLVSQALDDSIPSFLIPFRFSVKQSYMLEFGDRKMRVIKDGGVVVYPEDHERAGEEVVIATPFAAADLPLLRYAQTADVMIFTHADYPPKELMRYDHHDWRFANLVTNARTDSPENLRVTESGGDDARYVVTAVSSDKGESLASKDVLAVHPDGVSFDTAGAKFSAMYNWLYARNYSYVPTSIRFHTWTGGTMINFLKNHGYRDSGRGVWRDKDWLPRNWTHIKPNGLAGHIQWHDDYAPSALINECLAAGDSGWLSSSYTTALSEGVAKYVKDYNASLTKTRETKLAWDAVEGAESYKVYRETAVDGLPQFCLIGETTETSFFDNRLSATLNGLPEESEFFSGPDEYPGVCAFFEQRLILGRSNKKPNTFWGSDTGNRRAFSIHTPREDSDCYEFTLNSGEVNEIHWIVPMNDLLMGTSGGEWKAGGGGQAITPKNINARVQSWYGCSPLNPVVVGRSIIFAGRSRQNIRNFSYSLEADGYSGRDLTSYSKHLFTGRHVVSMCHQQEPSGIVWAVMSDGALLSCTHVPEEDVVAWARHDTAGRFENCASLVDMDGSDQIYFCVAREMNGAMRRFIETLEDPADEVAGESDGFFVDCGLTYRGEPVNRVMGLDHLEGMEIACLADGGAHAGLVVEEGAIQLPDGVAASVIHAGLPYQAELVTLELEPESGESLRNRPRFAVAAVIRLHNTRECVYSHTSGMTQEMKFRTTEAPGMPTRLFSGERSVAFSSPAGARSVKLTLASGSPVPFAVLGIVAEASCGQPA